MRSAAEVIEENNRQRYLARRRQVQRGLGAESKSRQGNRNSTQGSGARLAPGPQEPVRASVNRHTSTPGLLIVVVGSLAGLLVLAVIGAYSLIHEVFASVAR